MNANSKQVGGTHYQQDFVPQHWDIALALNWDYLTGAATKYLWRLGRKGDADKALEDLDKAIHYLQKKREVMHAQMRGTSKKVDMTILRRPSETDGEANSGYVNQD